MAAERMKKKLSDGDAFEILNGRVCRPSSRPKASLSALQWAADRANQSYGVFILHLTPEDEMRIQKEYYAYKAERDGDNSMVKEKM